MPIEIPNLDDRTYAELLEEARAALPGLHPDWTDHNPSDPGIALVELLAWLSEMLIYRTGQHPERSVRTFLRLLDGKSTPVSQQLELGEATRATLRTLRERWRAVTPEDYESLALYQWPGAPEAQQSSLEAGERRLARVHCLAECDVSSATPTARVPGHMSLVVLQGGATGSATWDAPRAALLEALAGFFRERRIVTTRLHVSGPTYVPVGISATLYLKDDALAADVRANAPAVLAGYFDPRTGGSKGGGWPFGREVPASEIYATLDGTRGVEFVEEVRLEVAPQLASRKLTEGGKDVAIRLEPHELPRVESSRIQLTLKERRGNTWEVMP